ncbi:hypothetical protein [Bradyrhizobium sp. BWA-3-5]|uniref:hypothetical protein n=1 Tax=Bradyrhizobium sp. BWA-3-5 TaxID=3080013 RepID=UPI00293EC968|nr:hypothetical protein [Bradyrhizobium sp. BWA-3-5]WOH63884.1 hypothetical protein RX331_24840 [Bradyrhizobium sp. BWA-3-5]
MQYPDWGRDVDRHSPYIDGRVYEKTVRFGIMNRNKRGITDPARHRPCEASRYRRQQLFS